MKEIQSIDIAIGEVWIQTVYRHCYWGRRGYKQSIDIAIGEVWIQTVYRHCYWGRCGYKQSIDIAIGGGGDTNSL